MKTTKIYIKNLFGITEKHCTKSVKKKVCSLLRLEPLMMIVWR